MCIHTLSNLTSFLGILIQLKYFTVAFLTHSDFPSICQMQMFDQELTYYDKIYIDDHWFHSQIVFSMAE